MKRLPVYAVVLVVMAVCLLQAARVGSQEVPSLDVPAPVAGCAPVVVEVDGRVSVRGVEGCGQLWVTLYRAAPSASCTEMDGERVMCLPQLKVTERYGTAFGFLPTPCGWWQADVSTVRLPDVLTEGWLLAHPGVVYGPALGGSDGFLAGTHGERECAPAVDGQTVTPATPVLVEEGVTYAG